MVDSYRHSHSDSQLHSDRGFHGHSHGNTEPHSHDDYPPHGHGNSPVHSGHDFQGPSYGPTVPTCLTVSVILSLTTTLTVRFKVAGNPTNTVFISFTTVCFSGEHVSHGHGHSHGYGDLADQGNRETHGYSPGYSDSYLHAQEHSEDSRDYPSTSSSHKAKSR